MWDFRLFVDIFIHTIKNLPYKSRVRGDEAIVIDNFLKIAIFLKRVHNTSIVIELRNDSGL